MPAAIPLTGKQFEEAKTDLFVEGYIEGHRPYLDFRVVGDDTARQGVFDTSLSFGLLVPVNDFLSLHKRNLLQHTGSRAREAYGTTNLVFPAREGLYPERTIERITIVGSDDYRDKTVVGTEILGRLESHVILQFDFPNAWFRIYRNLGRR